MPDDLQAKLTQAMGQLQPHELQELHTALYQARIGRIPGLDTAKVNTAWAAIQPVVAQAPSERGRPRTNISALREGAEATGNLVEGILSGVGSNPVQGAVNAGLQAASLPVDDFVRKQEGYSRGYRLAAAIGGSTGIADPKREEMLAAKGQTGAIAANAAPNMLAALVGLRGVLKDGAIHSNPTPIPQEIQATELGRVTPLSETGKHPGIPVGLEPRMAPTAPGATSPKARGPERSAITERTPKSPTVDPMGPNAVAPAPAVPQPSVAEAALDVGFKSKGLPEQRIGQPVAEVQPAAEMTYRIKASAVADQPNPQAGKLHSYEQPPAAEPPKVAVVEPTEPVQAPAVVAKGVPAKPAGQPLKEALPAEFDARVNRVIKSRDTAEAAKRTDELRGLTEMAKTLPPEEAAKLGQARLEMAAKLRAQAEEVRRVAASPEQLAALKEAKGGSLFGDWKMAKPSAEDVAEAKEAGKPVPKMHMVDLKGMDPGERDFYHQLLGHETSRVLTRDESGQPIRVQVNSDVEKAEVTKYVEQLKGDYSQHLAMLKEKAGGGFTLSPEEIDHGKDLLEQIETYSGVRDRLAKEGARKGIAKADEAGVVRVPGAIPDVSRKAADALMGGTGKYSHFKVSPERLRLQADRLEHAAALNEAVAKALGGQPLEKVEAPKEPVQVTINKKLQKAAKIEAQRAPSRPEWVQQQVDAGISQQEAILRDPKATEADKASAQNLLKTFRETVYNEKGEPVGTRRVTAPSEAPVEVTSSKKQLSGPERDELEKEVVRLHGQLQEATAKGEKARLKATIKAYLKELQPDSVSEPMDQAALHLFQQPYDRLTDGQKLKVKMSLVGPEAEGPTWQQRLEKVERPERTPDGKTQETLPPPFYAGFPMGEVEESVRSRVEQLHQLANPEGAALIADAVRAQGLATRDAAFRLYGRALGEYASNPGDPRALARALDIAKRTAEHGAIRATFALDMVKAIHDKLTETDISAKGLGKKELREGIARRKQALANADFRLEGMNKFFSKKSQLDGFEFQKAVQSDTWRQRYAPNSPEYAYAQFARDILDYNRSYVNQKTGRLAQFDENYFPQRWEGVHSLEDYANRLFGSGSQRPLRGRMSFLKDKYYGSLQAGWDAGLRPLHYNPADAIYQVMSESAHFVTGQDWINSAAARGDIARFRGSPRNIPADWVPLDHRVAGPGVYAPEELAKVFNRYFDPGIFRGSKFMDSVITFKNYAQQAAVSLSGFHFLTTGWAAWTSDFAQGWQHLLRGNFLETSQAAGRFATLGLKDVFNGYKFLKEYKNTLPDQVQGLMKAYVEGGGGPSGTQGFMRLDAIQNLRKAWEPFKPRNWGNQGALDYAKAAGRLVANVLPAAMRAASWPVQEAWVKNIKAGVTMKALELEMDRLGPGATRAERQQAFGRVINDMDDRFGQVIRSNRFWSKSLERSLDLSFKFVDWNYGTIRGMYGAAKDVPRAAFAGGITQRLAFALSAPITWGIMGSVINAALTGEAPKDAEDMFFPRNGRLDAAGKPERVISSGYLRAAWEWGRPAGRLAQGDVPGVFSTTAEAFKSRFSPIVDLMKAFVTNRDFQGNTVVNREDPFIRQLGQAMGAMIAQFRPISVSSAERAEQMGGGLRGKALSYAGIQIAPYALELDTTPAESELREQLRVMHGEGYAAPEILQRERAINRLVMTERNEPGKLGQVFQEERKAGHLHADDMQKVIDRMQKPFIDRVNELNLQRAVSVYEKATTPYEKAAAGEAVGNKLGQLFDMSDADRAKLQARIIAARQSRAQGARK